MVVSFPGNNAGQELSGAGTYNGPNPFEDILIQGNVNAGVRPPLPTVSYGAEPHLPATRHLLVHADDAVRHARIVDGHAVQQHREGAAEHRGHMELAAQRRAVPGTLLVDHWVSW